MAEREFNNHRPEHDTRPDKESTTKPYPAKTNEERKMRRQGSKESWTPLDKPDCDNAPQGMPGEAKMKEKSERRRNSTEMWEPRLLVASELCGSAADNQGHVMQSGHS